MPQLTLTSEMDLSIRNGGVRLHWSDYDIENKYFVIYRKKENSEYWEKLVSLEDKFNGSSYIDNLGNDIAKPSVPVINIEKNQGENSIEIKQSSKDSGTKYEYYIEAYDEKNTLLASSK